MQVKLFSQMFELLGADHTWAFCIIRPPELRFGYTDSLDFKSKPYGNSIQEIRRYASFIGTSNQKDLLTDPSGSRRFICIEVTAPIDTNVTINYRQLYAQAMEAIVKGERYWFDDADEAILRETNREFEQMSPVEQLFHCYFRSPEEGEEGEYLSPMQILEHLRSKNKDIKLTASNVNHFGRILRKNNLEYKRTCKGIVYRVEKL